MRWASVAGIICVAGAAIAGDVPGRAALPAPVSDADFMAPDPASVALGHKLFYDPILSGNRNISCATCHHPRFGTSDGVSLSLGEGGIGLGPDRRVDPDNPPEELIPRNAPALFNLGAHEFTVLFHDGRIEADPSRASGFRTPMGPEMVEGFDSLLSAQTMFPVLSQDEMAGHYSENEVAQAVRQGFITGPDGAWEKISARVRAIPDYAAGFEALLGRPAATLSFADISNAIADFIAVEWRADQSPFDAHLRGEASLTGAAAAGMALFYGPARCAGCHSGPFQTDHGFHAMGVPQFGPGKAARFESHRRDMGRMRVTGRAEDAYAFRTPSLRNVAQTGPYGHVGSHTDLGAFLRFHIDPVGQSGGYDPAAARLPELHPGAFDPLADSAERAAIAAAVTAQPVALEAEEITAILAFLDALTDTSAIAGRLGVPETVPSGLPVDQ
ncbi:cytochrome-c peroxidase [Poseidonocella sedimentorum]|uniref:Cytochrome c peroxidase n=1 Tax=Poseidonocella sedimentorum TaxID=871652 RepID=A0A1I6EFP6_9RHOB|nr:cytochrome c peroxidase [Poseidonocella sedimentorum]SFR16599.1 cytochrome c peroxidase [Poseidonocella sedimentorum]